MGNTGVLLPFDMDNDGDTDLFAATRCMPSNYGVIPESYVYVNDGKGSVTLLPKEQAARLQMQE